MEQTVNPGTEARAEGAATLTQADLDGWCSRPSRGSEGGRGGRWRRRGAEGRRADATAGGRAGPARA